MGAGTLNYGAAVRLIKKGNLPLCLFLYGPEEFLKEDLVRRATDAALAPGLRSFNFSAYDLADSSVAEVLAAVEAFPALSGARVVVVRNADRLKRAKKEAELLKNGLVNPAPFLCFLLVAADPDPSAGFLKSLPPTLVHVALKSPSERDMDKWLSARSEDAGISMAPEPRRLLLALAGRSMWRVDNEFEKLCINAGNRKEITEADVLALVGGPSERSPFALADAVVKGDRGTAASVAADLLDRGEAPVAMAGLLTWHLVRRWGASANRPPAGGARLREFREKAVVLCEADHALKRSKLDRTLAAQLMVDALTKPGS
jgi:DNA polymerase-3 subunit delta